MSAPAVIAGIGTAFSIFGAIKANKEQKKIRSALGEANRRQAEAEKTRAKMGFMEMLNEKRKAQREARITRGKILAHGAGSSAIAESGQLGAIGSLSSEFGRRLGGLETRNAMQQDISQLNIETGNFQTSANQASSRAGGWTSFSNLGMSILNTSNTCLGDVHLTFTFLKSSTGVNISDCMYLATNFANL